MSPAKRTDKKRRRAWAAPFILTTVLAAPGCVVKEGPPPSQPAPKGVTTDHRGGQPHEAPPTDPNAPAPNTDSTAPTVIANPPPPTAAPALPDAPNEGGELVTRKDGTCWFHYDAAPCPPDATCNPPPPRQVKCK